MGAPTLTSHGVRFDCISRFVESSGIRNRADVERHEQSWARTLAHVGPGKPVYAIVMDFRESGVSSGVSSSVSATAAAPAV
jgi:hypothetical protein